jgi:vacuolar-type H+-ATPase subunit F/Vma7
MELNVHALCTPPVAVGFALAGLRAEEVDEATVAEALRRLAERAPSCIVLVEDVLHRAIPPELLARIDRAGAPVVVPFPSPAWERRGIAEQYVLEILRQAVGYRVRAP